MLSVTVANFSNRFPKLATALSEDEIEQLLAVLTVQELEASEDLIAEGTHTDALFLVWDGELDILMNTPQGQRKVACVEAGEILGEISIMDPGPATATVRTEQGCTALHMSRSKLEAFWDQHPHVASVFLEELSRAVAERIRSADSYLRSLHGLTDISPSRATDTVIAAHTRLFQAESE
jgi:CRP-like cAMP-binding protein